MSSSSKKATAKTPLWRQHVLRLPSAAYFLSENKPQFFDHIRYLISLDPSSNDRDKATDTWRNSVIPSLQSSNLQELQEAGRRLAKEWNYSRSARESFWSSLKEKEQEKEKRRIRLERLKMAADASLEHTEKLLVDEVRVDVEEARAKLQQAKQGLLASDRQPLRTIVASFGEDNENAIQRGASQLSTLIGRNARQGIPASTKNKTTSKRDISGYEEQPGDALFHEVGESREDDEATLVSSRTTSFEARRLKHREPRPPPISTAAANPSDACSSPVSLSSPTPSSSSAEPLSPKRKRKGSIVETEEPWQSLMHCLIKIVNGQKDTIYPHPWPTMPLVHKLLFQLAVNSLKTYEAQQSKERDITLLKDAQVAMSCLVNTISGRTCTFFEHAYPDLIDKARELCKIPNIDLHPATAILEKYKNILADKGVHRLLRCLAEDWGKIGAEYPDVDTLPAAADIEDRTLQVLILLCKFVIRPPFGKRAPSENDILLLWVSVFSLLAKNITLHTGEKVMLASKAVRQMQSSEFGEPSDSGRKSDCLFMFDEIELSNIEFKRDGIDETEIRVQNRKNVRLGRCLQETHATFGIKAPSVLMADVIGYTGVVYQVVQMDNVAVSGKATHHVVQLPSTEGGLLEFMNSPSLAILWNFMNYLEAQGPKLRRWKDQQQAVISKTKMVQSIFQRETEVPYLFKKFENSVTMSPSKKRSM